MFEFIQGKVVEKTPTKAIVETHGIGYRLMIDLHTYTHLPLGERVELFLSQIIREDSHTLYAFLQKKERDLFETLVTLSGIGPKSALSILGHLGFDSFQRAISASDVKALSKIPGIGKKTAEKLIIEMRDKMKKNLSLPSETPQTHDPLSDAIQALVHLGYNPLDAQKAVQQVLLQESSEKDLSQIITAALQKI